MKKNILFAIIMFLNFTANAQQKGDYNWVFGKLTSSGFPLFGGTIVDFNFSPPDIFQQNLGMKMDAANTSMSDQNGSLLFYSNGIKVYDSNHEQLSNGFDLNLDYTVGSTAELLMVQGILTLPDPNDTLQYYLLHFGRQIVGSPIYLISSPLFYSKVNMELPDFPNGIIQQKNTIISEEAFDSGKITATRHANGRDWWIILSENRTNRYHRFLLSPEGIELIGVQELEEIHNPGLGQAVFAPDGSTYVNMSLHEFSENYMDIYDFDRCTGELSNHHNFFFDDYVGAGGVAISPSSQFLYLVTSDNIRQFDLWATDVIATEDTVAINDGSFEPIIHPSTGDTISLANRWFMAQLAPDGKIYINHTNGVSTLAVIENPDLSGDSCNVQQHSFSLGVLNSFSLPNFPNYRLGALEDSPCDTLDLVNTNEVIVSRLELEVFPNPIADMFTVVSSTSLRDAAILILYNQLGQEVVRFSMDAGKERHEFSIGEISAGIYFYGLEQNGAVLASGKVVVE